jgi:hypothetical protein
MNNSNKVRKKCITSHRKVFTVNEANPKEKVIFDFLSTLYNESDIIKDILYDYIISNNLQTAQHSVNVVSELAQHQHNNVHVTVQDSVNINANTCNNSVNSIQTLASDNKLDSKPKGNDDFIIDLDNIENKEIKVEINKEDEIKQANNNALDFLKNY